MRIIIEVEPESQERKSNFEYLGLQMKIDELERNLISEKQSSDYFGSLADSIVDLIPGAKEQGCGKYEFAKNWIMSITSPTAKP